MSQAEVIAATGSKAVPAYYITAVAISRSWWSAAREIACGAPQWFSLKCDSKAPAAAQTSLSSCPDFVPGIHVLLRMTRRNTPLLSPCEERKQRGNPVFPAAFWIASPACHRARIRATRWLDDGNILIARSLNPA
jgi:hypothetical protein